MNQENHTPPYDGQRVDGMFVTRIQTCGHPCG